MDLTREAAEFYVLEYLAAVEEYKPAKRAQNKQIKTLSIEFNRYLAHAIGGEVECARTLGRTKAQKRLIRRGKCKTVTDIRMARDIFAEGYWSCGYGGRPWANIADTLYQYRTKRLNRKLFVDRVWSLKHNNDFVFDKGYNYDYRDLGHVLDCQAHGNVDALLPYCRRNVKRLHEKAGKWRKRCENTSRTAKSKRSNDVRSSGSIRMSWDGLHLETRGD